mmetsp:Transcript_16329/g.39169  ORF Transcript_16329/g.39169 Transcript_16329/m.39169 type:complete len:214 (-) Transcript_16329:224-865(-)
MNGSSPWFDVPLAASLGRSVGHSPWAGAVPVSSRDSEASDSTGAGDSVSGAVDPLRPALLTRGLRGGPYLNCRKLKGRRPAAGSPDLVPLKGKRRSSIWSSSVPTASHTVMLCSPSMDAHTSTFSSSRSLVPTSGGGGGGATDGRQRVWLSLSLQGSATAMLMLLGAASEPTTSMLWLTTWRRRACVTPTKRNRARADRWARSMAAEGILAVE